MQLASLFFAERLALLRAVDAVEAVTLRVLVVQDLDGVAVKNGDDEAEEVGGVSRPSIIRQRPHSTEVRGPCLSSPGRSCQRLAYFIFLGS